MTTLLDLTPRLAARHATATSHSTVVPMQRDATVTQLPVGNARRRHHASVDDAIEALSMLLTQSDSYSRNTAVPADDRKAFTGEVQAYAIAVGILAHPLCPPDAFQVKRDILAALEVGPLTVDRIQEIAATDMEPLDAS